MTPERFQLVSHLFEQACRLDVASAAAFLEEHCRDDAELRGQVEELLSHDATPQAFHGGSSAGAGARLLARELAADSGPQDFATAPRLGRVGRCRIVRTIAAGGMGTVYEAVQDSPRRTVALKILRHGIASPAALRRFEYEGDVLARLRHPGIAQIYEAGTHDEDGRRVPYFIMEYVTQARTLTAYARAADLGTRERLNLFMRVCDAVHHGHQKGIIHRDLKPGNILVDDQGWPRVIDFGVARSTDADVAMTTRHTDVGQLVGTLQYMSPEQCRADPHDLDTRSDVYALGLVLYELLCGRRPYDVGRLPLPEATRVVREVSPERLSSHDQTLQGDIETIVHKALQKDRDHRYASASELGRDIQRYLEGQAIVARPPSAAYQLRLLIRRHTALFGAVAAVFVVLLAGVVFSSAMYLTAQRSGTAALAAQEEAGHRRAQAEAVTEFLTEMLASSNPLKRPGEDVRVRDVLDLAAADVESGFEDQPLVEAMLRTTIGRTYLALAMPREAEPHVDAALEIRVRELGPDHLDVADALMTAAQLDYDLGRHAAGLPKCERALAIRREHLGNSHTDVAEALIMLGFLQWASGEYAMAEARVREALEIRQALFDSGHPDVMDALHMHGLTLRANGQWREAELEYRRALALRRDHYGDDHPMVATTLNNLAVLMRIDKRDYAESAALFREALDIRRRALGNQHEHVASTLRNLGNLLLFMRNYDEAETLLREALQIRRDLLGDDHPYALNALNDVASVSTGRGNYAAAEPLRRTALAAAVRHYGDGARQLIRYRHNLAWTLSGLGRYEEAESQYRSALLIGERTWGPDHDTNLTLLRHLIDLYLVQGRFGDARTLAEDYLIRRARIAEEPDAGIQEINARAWVLLTCDVVALRDPQQARTLIEEAARLTDYEDAEVLDTLIVAQEQTGDTAAAIETARAALALFPPEASPRRAEVEERLAGALEAHGDLVTAESLLRTLLEQRQQELPVGHGLICDAQLGLGDNLIRQGRFEEAEVELQAALRSHRDHLSADHWRIAEVECATGAAVVGQGRIDEGAALLQACARMAEQIGAPHRRRAPALERLVHFLEAHDRAEEAAPWRRVLDQTVEP